MPVPKGFRETKLRPKIRCAERSHRIKILSRRTRLVICCPAGTTEGKANWNRKTKRCRIGTRAVAKQTRIR